MNFRHRLLALGTILLSGPMLLAQACDPTTAPGGLSATYTPGSGALLQWTAVPSSIGVQIKATTPSGANVTRRLVGAELDQYLVPDAVLDPGVYTWQVQAACSTVPPYGVTPVSPASTFTVGGSGTCPATVTDVDGNVYNTVQIGGQCWMAENLATETYGDGSAIPTGLGSGAWSSATSGAFAVYGNNPATSNKGTYGLLYNWYAVADLRSICPAGWHVPTDGEWTELTDHLGGTGVAGGPMKTTGTRSAGTGLWQAPNTGATNGSGFSALPGGARYDYGNFSGVGYYGLWWSASESNIYDAWGRGLDYDDTFVYRYAYNKQFGFSVRCVRDE
jgi:uncharacterized protein (TIGR02145 family)